MLGGRTCVHLAGSFVGAVLVARGFVGQGMHALQLPNTLVAQPQSHPAAAGTAQKVRMIASASHIKHAIDLAGLIIVAFF